MPTKLRVVLDTNVIISGLISPKGPPAGILKAIKAGQFTLVTSQAINEEVLEVMNRPRLRDKYGLADHMFDISWRPCPLSRDGRYQGPSQPSGA